MSDRGRQWQPCTKLSLSKHSISQAICRRKQSMSNWRKGTLIARRVAIIDITMLNIYIYGSIISSCRWGYDVTYQRSNGHIERLSKAVNHWGNLMTVCTSCYLSSSNINADLCIRWETRFSRNRRLFSKTPSEICSWLLQFVKFFPGQMNNQLTWWRSWAFNRRNLKKYLSFSIPKRAISSALRLSRSTKQTTGFCVRSEKIQEDIPYVIKEAFIMRWIPKTLPWK